MEISRDEGVLITVIHPNGTEAVVSVPLPSATTVDQQQRDAMARILAGINQNLATIAANLNAKTTPSHIRIKIDDNKVASATVSGSGLFYEPGT